MNIKHFDNFKVTSLNFLLDEKAILKGFIPLIKDKNAIIDLLVQNNIYDKYSFLASTSIKKIITKSLPMVNIDLLYRFFHLYDTNQKPLKEIINNDQTNSLTFINKLIDNKITSNLAFLTYIENKDIDEIASYYETSKESINKLISLCYLMLLPGVKYTRANLYYQAGLKNLIDFSLYTEKEIQSIISKMIEDNHLTITCPLLKEINTHKQVAKALIIKPIKTFIFKNQSIASLGFGTMRLPVDQKGRIIEEKFEAMVDYAIAQGVNYFDTAYPYHEGNSEIALGKALKKYPRNTFYIASKYPGHQIASSYNPEAIFEEQLKKCQVTYFDFYLLHNVYEDSIKTYLDPKWNILNYFLKQKELGRIKHLGFSSHGEVDLLTTFLEDYHQEMEFCQIQLNYVDWTLQKAKEKHDLLKKLNIPVWVMEPVRGGKLAKLSDEYQIPLFNNHPEQSVVSYAFKFLLTLPNMGVILSGMSDMKQMIDNIETFKDNTLLTNTEFDSLVKLGKSLQKGIPCTSCQYCLDSCSKKLNIPKIIAFYNELLYAPTSMNVGMRIEALEDNKKPNNCISCGKCKRACPQKINIPQVIKDLNNLYDKLPKWKDICAKRDEAAKKTKTN